MKPWQSVLLVFVAGASAVSLYGWWSLKEQKDSVNALLAKFGVK